MILRLWLALWLLWAIPSFAAECPPPNMAGPTKLSLSMRSGGIVVRNGAARRELTALAQDGAGPMGRGVNAGLTRSNANLNIAPQLAISDMGQGRYCVMVREVKAEWVLSDILVDIAAEYRPGSCAYGVVREHEFIHVENSRDAFQRHTEPLRERLTAVVAGLKPYIVTGKPTEAAQQTADRLMAVARAEIEAFQSERKRADAAIDTPQSYKATAARCKDW